MPRFPMDQFNIKNTLLYFIAISIIAVFFYCGLFALPSADDFFYANLAREQSLINAQIVHYLDWSGRYSATFLLTLFSLNGFEYYWLVPWICISSLIGSFYILMRTIFSSVKDECDFFLFSLSLTALFLSVSTAGPGHGIKVINEGFYWYSGAITYIISLSLYFILVTALANFEREKHTALRILLSLLLIVIVVGLNETAMFLICFTIVPWLLIRRNQFGYAATSILTLTIIICSCFVVFAPGNSVRMATSDGGNLLSAIGICFEKLGQILFFYLINPFVWTFCLVFHKPLNTIEKELSKKILYKNLQNFGGLVLVFLLYLPVAYSLNSGAPDRLVAFIGFFALLISIIYIHRFYKKVVCNRVSTKTITYSVAVFSILGSYIFVNPFFIGSQTIVTGHAYYKVHQERVENIKKQKRAGKKVARVPAIHRNTLLLFEDLLPGTTNKQYAHYYGLEGVLLLAPSSK